ncbi:molybdenum cofactor biosynthesis protein 1 isoform X1 [Danaus plexippus]|uniref:molybdenum cofactor biosynthesis protein 1 isoform X1 n=2 Tax=Danaus plexippus TaxID=13037 RepID=UPI002AAFD4F3|nr:molybdenum cofactor biosynthesis protein 1 isoform X1 [Danaus plexippus]
MKAKMFYLFYPKLLQNTSSYQTFSLKRFINSDLKPNIKETANLLLRNDVPPLVDLYGRKHDYLRISLTEKCNLRCQYCMPAEGVKLSPRDKILSNEEVLRLARVFATLGINKIRLTGGEPTLRKDLVNIVQELTNLHGISTVAMTTNGIALTRKLPSLQRAGLSALNLSLDSLKPERFERMARRPGLPHVLASMDLALQLGFKSVKINTVLMKGFNDDEICDFIELTRDRDMDIRFIEFMPFSGNRWEKGERMVSEKDAISAAIERYGDLIPLPPTPCRTATLWQVPGYTGRVGFISSMTKPFCSTCNRLRLTADGNLKVCLFGESETNLRDAIRAGVNDDDIETLVRSALRRKLPRHAAEPRRLQARAFCTSAPQQPPSPPPTRRRLPQETEEDGVMTHLDKSGRARMVDVGEKPVTVRTAEAECYLVVGARLLRLLRSSGVPKGDALTVAQVAGTMAAKRTSDLIPMCHPLALTLARVRVMLPKESERGGGGRVRVTCQARATAKTGVEMEALTGCSVAALTLYDMCKSVDKNMQITDLKVISKTGGKSSWGDVEEKEEEGFGPKVREHDTSPHAPGETYVPTNLLYF